MKKTITSAGLVVVGAAALQAQNAAQPALTSVQTTKPWSVSASLRGFYDDNYATRPARIGGVDTKRDSFGFELSPSAGINWVLPQTYVGLSYQYGMKYYEDRPRNTADHTHQADLKLSHAFTELYKLDVSDSFVVAQEPDLIDKGIIARPLRAEGSNIRNTASANFTAGLTEKLSSVLGYSNSIYDYEQEGPASLSSLLDRMEHLATLNVRWQALPTTVGILGYQFGVSSFDDQKIIGIDSLGRLVRSDWRDSTSHYAYLGADHSFTSTLNGSLRVGAQFTDYSNADDNTVSPYADGSLTWTYTPGSYIQLGVRHQRQATDVGFYQMMNTPSLDQEATTAYASVNHKITAKLMGSLMGQFQNSSFNAGGADSLSENFLLAGLNVSYEINKFLSADAGYNFDRLDSDLSDRSFTRNRVYLGIRATY